MDTHVVDHLNNIFDLILFGNESADAGGYQVGIRVAGTLGRPMVNGIKGIDVRAGGVTARREVDAFEGATGRPVFFKSLMLLFAVETLSGVFGDRARFLVVRRDPLATAVSILRGKRNKLADERTWFSLRPPEYPALRELDPVPCGQDVVRDCRMKDAVFQPIE